MTGMAEPLRVACIGMGWWSDVLADAMKRSDKLKIVACYTRSEDKRAAFAKKYGCRPAASYEEVLADRDIEAIVNTTPNDVHLPTTTQAAEAGKHVFLDKPIANNVTEGRAITEVCRKAGVVLGMGYQRRRESHFRWIKQQIDAGVFGKLVNAEANISRDRLGKIDLSSWRYQAAGMPGGVMLQIGIHYTDVLTYLMGPVKAVRGQFAQLVLPGDNPGRRQPDPRARQRRAFDAERQLRLGVGILPDEYLRQGRHRLLRPARRPAAAQARRGQAGRGAGREERHLRGGARGVRCGNSRQWQTRGGRRLCHDLARRGAGRNFVGARRPPGGSGGGIEKRLSGRTR